MCWHTKKFIYSRCWHMSDAPEAGKGLIPPQKCQAVIDALERYHPKLTEKKKRPTVNPYLVHFPPLPPPFASGGLLDVNGKWASTLWPHTAAVLPTPPSYSSADTMVGPDLTGFLFMPQFQGSPTPPCSDKGTSNPEFDARPGCGVRGNPLFSGSCWPSTPAICEPVFGAEQYPGNVLVRRVDWWCPTCVRERQDQLELEVRLSRRWRRVRGNKWFGLERVEDEPVRTSERTATVDGRAEHVQDPSSCAACLTAGEGGPLIVGDRGDEEIKGAWDAESGSEPLSLKEYAGWRAWELHCRGPYHLAP